MIFSTLTGAVLYAISLYMLFDLLKIKQKIYLIVLALFLPARFLILRSIGAPEPWFLFSIVSSIYFYKKEKYLHSALFLAFAQIIKTPAVLLLAAYGLDYLIRYKQKPEKKYFQIFGFHHYSFIYNRSIYSILLSNRQFFSLFPIRRQFSFGISSLSSF